MLLLGDAEGFENQSPYDGSIRLALRRAHHGSHNCTHGLDLAALDTSNNIRVSSKCFIDRSLQGTGVTDTGKSTTSNDCVWITFARNQQLVFDNAFDMLPVRWIQADPMCLENLFSSVNITTPGHYKYNWMHLNDPALDKVLAEGRAETDGPKRITLYQEAQKIIMDTGLWFPVHNQVQTVAYRTNRTGYRFSRADWVVVMYDVATA